MRGPCLMLTVGLTGGSGAGKGEVCRVLESLGIPCIDTDRVYHDLLYPGSPCVKELVSRFGSVILDKEGGIDRKTLSGIVFGSDGSESLRDLNRITHKYILEESSRLLAMYCESGYDMAVIDAPQLYESGFDRYCDCVIAVISDDDIRIRRIMERDGLDRDMAEKRLLNQKSNSFFKSKADFVIYNNGSFDSLRRRVTEIAEMIGNGELCDPDEDNDDGNGYIDYSSVYFQ